MTNIGYTDYKVWQMAMNLAAEIYKVVKLLPLEERYSLGDQMRRAAVSVPSNIAEGHSRGTTKDFIRFLYISRGSVAELETQLRLSVKINYLKNEDIEHAMLLCSQDGKMLTSLIHKLNTKL